MSKQSPHVFKRCRKLGDEADVYTQNAWDDIEWTQEMYNEADAMILEQQRASTLSGGEVQEKESLVSSRWNEFYAQHEDKFFKDRKWIFSEFAELLRDITDPDKVSEPYHVLEVGCGVGNSVVLILEHNNRPNLHMSCCDVSDVAIATLKKRDFHAKHRDKITAFQADVCRDFKTKIKSRFPGGSLDTIMLIFTLSAFKPELMKRTIQDLATLLRPGGVIFFRDYAKYDMTQLRFKSNAFLRENYYIRADGTTTYFFTEDFVRDLFADLVEVELKLDKRLLVNRLKGVKMCRCWIQGKFMRPVH